MKTLLQLAATFALVALGVGVAACNHDTHSSLELLDSTGPVFVRSVWCHDLTDGDVHKCDVTLETESHLVYVMKFYDLPPVWVGMHCIIGFRDDLFPYKKAESVRSLQ